jgi:hypothetical protein
MRVSSFMHEITACEVTFESPNGLDEFSLQIIEPGRDSKWRDFSLIRTNKLHEVFKSFPKGLHQQLYELQGTFRYYTIEDEDLEYLFDWITYVVSPSDFALWEELQEFQFHELIREYEHKLDQKGITSKIKEEEKQISELCQEDYRKEIQEQIQEILSEQEQDVIEMDNESAYQRRMQDSRKIESLAGKIGLQNPQGGKSWSECLNLGPEIGEDLAYLWALESEAGHGLII